MSASQVEVPGPLGLEKPPRRSWSYRLPALLMLPREHGAWAMLLVAYSLGTLSAGWSGWPSLLLLVAIMTLFIAGRPLELAIQSGQRGALLRLGIYGLAGGAAGLALLLIFGLWMLLPVGAGAGLVLGAQLLLRRHRLERTWPARLASIAALSSAGIAAYYVATGTLDGQAIGVWLLSFLYSGASVFYVRLYYRGPAKRRSESPLESKRTAQRQLVTYLAIALVALVAAGLGGLVPPLAFAALFPLIAKVAWAFREGGSRPSLRRLGFLEVGHSALFLVLAAGIMRMWS